MNLLTNRGILFGAESGIYAVLAYLAAADVASFRATPQGMLLIAGVAISIASVRHHAGFDVFPAAVLAVVVLRSCYPPVGRLSYFVLGCLAVAISKDLVAKKVQSPCALDFAVAGAALLLALNGLAFRPPIEAVLQWHEPALLAGIYFFSRMTLRGQALFPSTVALSVIAVFYSFLAISGSVELSHMAASLGINATDLRAYLHIAPASQPPGLWAAVLLAIAGFPLTLAMGASPVFRRIGLGVTALVCLSALASCSRGVTMGVAAFLAASTVLLLTARGVPARRTLLSGFVLSLACIAGSLLIPAFRTSVTTAAMFSTESHSRSAHGREAIWKASAAMVAASWKGGVGAGQFAAVYPGYRGEGAPAFASTAYNTVLEIVAEHGLAGAIALAAVSLCAGAAIFMAVRDPRTSVIGAAGGAALIAVAVRDLTYSSATANITVAVLCCVILARLGHAMKPVRGVALGYAMPTFVALLLLLSTATRLRAEAAERAYADFVIAFEESDWVRALKDITDVTERRPSYAYAWACKGLVEARLAGFDYSLEELLRGYSPLPLRDRGRLEDAAVSYGRALQLHPQNAGFHRNLGWILVRLGRGEEGIAEMQRAQILDPEDPLPTLSLALLHEASGEQEAALREYESSLVRRPDLIDTPLYRALRTRLPWQPLIGNAIRQLRTTVESTHSPVDQARLASLLLADGRMQESITQLDSATSRLPNLPRAWVNLGSALCSAYGPDRATRSWSLAAVLAKRDPLLYVRMGNCAAQSRDIRRAAAHYTTAARLLAAAESTSSRRAARFYGLPVTVGDDVVPAGLLRYATIFDVSLLPANVSTQRISLAH